MLANSIIAHTRCEMRWSVVNLFVQLCPFWEPLLRRRSSYGDGDYGEGDGGYIGVPVVGSKHRLEILTMLVV